MDRIYVTVWEINERWTTLICRYVHPVNPRFCWLARYGSSCMHACQPQPPARQIDSVDPTNPTPYVLACRNLHAIHVR